MDPKTRKRLDKVIAEAVDLTGDGMDEFAAAREALTAQTTDVLRELAVAALVDTVRRRMRSNVLDIERSSETASARRRGSQSWKTPEYFDAMDKIRERHERHMAQAIDRLVSELKMEWTAELLAADFTLADGSRVTWGDATIQQHEERAALFQRNAVANSEGAARHLHAVAQLKGAGAPTLADLVGRAA